MRTDALLSHDYCRIFLSLFILSSSGDSSIHAEVLQLEKCDNNRTPACRKSEQMRVKEEEEECSTGSDLLEKHNVHSQAVLLITVLQCK